MRTTPRVTRILTFVACLSSALFSSRGARAGSMDPAPERLVLQPPGLQGGDTCQSIAANPESVVQNPAYKGQLPNNFPCRPNNPAFKNMVSELGFAIAPTAFHPARTTGYGGFALTLEASYTHINADDTDPTTHTQYWHQGTQGPIDPNTHQFSTVNNSPDSLLQIYSLKARKGLPFGFEITGDLGYIANTTMWVGGADIRWSLLEGFRTGALGILPDVAVGGGVRTLTGTSKFTLTTVGVDVQVSKPIAIADSATVTPYVGYQRLFVFGDSTIVDLTPQVDPAQQCGLAGHDQNGAPICRNKLSNGADNNGDFNNNATFDRVRTQYDRLIVGLSYRYELLFLAGQFLVDITPQNDTDLQTARMWTMSFEGGVYF